MTLFEYLAVAFGLLYSLAALRLLGGLPAALAPDRRYFSHFGLATILLSLVAISFWTFWSLRDVDWTFPGFVVALTVPGLLYYCAAALIPENPAEVPSWEIYYFDVHRRFYWGMAAWAVAAASSATVNLGMGLAHPARGIHIVVLAIGVAGATSSHPRFHQALVILVGLLMIGASLAQLEPDWLAPR